MSPAARRYLNADALADTAEHLHVSPTTPTRELRLARTPIQPAAVTATPHASK